MKYGLLGKSLKHSYSKEIHELLGYYKYEYFEEDDLDKFFARKDINGINVTIPYKEDVIKYLDEMSEDAKKIGCVNTIKFANTIKGYNTDIDGMEYMISRIIDLKGKEVVILGDGATSKTAVECSKRLQARTIKVISRKGEHKFEDLDYYKNCEVLINATPVGMYPNNLKSVIKLGKIKPKAVFDVIYNPNKTSLLMDCDRLRIPNDNGLRMLVYQAVKACEIFTSKKIDDDVVEEIVQKIRTKNMNIALVGMPGSGKSTVAKIIAKNTDKKLVDIDKIITQRYGSINDIFAVQGEKYFRKIESEVLEEFSKEKNLVIATGGGGVTVKKNFYYLHQNSVVYWIDRPNSKLSRKNRPIYKTNTMREIRQNRNYLYRRFSDKYFNNYNAKTTAKLIVEDFNETIYY